MQHHHFFMPMLLWSVAKVACMAGMGGKDRGARQAIREAGPLQYFRDLCTTSLIFLPYSLAPDEFGAKPSPQDAAQSSSLGLSCPVSSPQKSTRQEDFVAILRRDHHVHLERCSSSSTGAQSPHDVPRPRPRPPGSPDTQFGHLLELIECPLWVQSLELHPSQCFEALQPSTMVELAECCFRCWIRQHREGSRYRRYFELSPLYILICITHEFLSFPNIIGLMQHQS